jgi:tight adherence protein C
METSLTGFMTWFASGLLPAQWPLLIAVLACITLLVMLVGCSSTFRSYKTHQELQQRIVGVRSNMTWGPRRGHSTVTGWFFQMLKVVGKVNTPGSEAKLSMVRQTLVQAGYRGADAPFIFLGIKLYLAVLVPMAYVAMRSLTPHLLPMSAFILLSLAVLGFYAPGLWVSMKIRYRSRKVFEGFPDALDLVVVCVEAGLGLDAAIQKVGEEFHLTNRILSEEFRLLNLGLRAGQSRQLAFLSLSRRIKVEEVNNFVSLLIQTEQFGTSIAQALRVHADSMRLKRRQFAEERATKLPVKLLFPLLLFVFPGLLLIILGPGFLRLMKVFSHIIKSGPAF